MPTRKTSAYQRLLSAIRTTTGRKQRLLLDLLSDHAPASMENARELMSSKIDLKEHRRRERERSQLLASTLDKPILTNSTSLIPQPTRSAIPGRRPGRA
jgi:hypothetical protein